MVPGFVRAVLKFRQKSRTYCAFGGSKMSISEGSTRESQETGRDLAGFFEHRFGATPEVLESVMNLASGSHVDFADLYFEHTVSETMSLEEGIVKKAGSHVSQGA